MNSNFSDEQIKAYAAAFEEGDAIWCADEWWDVSKLTGISGFKEKEYPYEITTLDHYELQGGEKVVPLSKFMDDIEFGKTYRVELDSYGTPIVTDDIGSNFVPDGKNWAVIPRYEQVIKNEESKFKKGDKVLVNGFIDGTIVEALGNQKYLVSIVFRSGVEEINEFNEYQLEPAIEEPPAPKVANDMAMLSSNEIALDEVAIHSEIITRLVKQTIKGVKKYGDPVQHDSLSAVEWIDHAIDESVDQIVYLTALKHSLLSKGEMK